MTPMLRDVCGAYEQLHEQCSELLQSSESFVKAIEQITGFSDPLHDDSFSPLAQAARARICTWHRSFVQQFLLLHQSLPDGPEKALLEQRFKTHCWQSAHWMSTLNTKMDVAGFDDGDSMFANTPPLGPTDWSRRSSLPSTQSSSVSQSYSDMSPLALPMASISVPQSCLPLTTRVPSFDLDVSELEPSSRPPQAHPQQRFLLRAGQKVLNMISTGTKTSVPKITLGQMQVFGGRYHILRSETGRTYCCTSSLPEFGGSYGKLRYAVGVETGEALAIKEVRFPANMARKLLDGKMPKTYFSEIPSLLNELSMMQCFEPNLRVHDVIEVEDKLYIVMDQLCGDCLDYNGLPMPIRMYFVYDMMHQVARTLQRCHQAGFIHHDVKAENFLYREDGRVFLSDYGLALPRYATGQAPVGTTYYPPEVLLDVPTSLTAYDTPVDIWGLGITFLNIFADRDLSIPMLGWRHLHRSPARVRSYAEEYAGWFAQVVCDNALNPERLINQEQYPAYADLGQFIVDLMPTHPETINFVITRLLHPVAENRASAQEVAEWFESVLALAKDEVRTRYAGWFCEYAEGRSRDRRQLNRILRRVAMRQAYDAGYIQNWPM